MRRFDLDGDAKLSFTEFAEALTPIQPDVIQNPFRHHTRMGNTLNSTIHDNLRATSLRSIDEIPNSERQACQEVDQKQSIQQQQDFEDHKTGVMEITADDWNGQQAVNSPID